MARLHARMLAALKTPSTAFLCWACLGVAYGPLACGGTETPLVAGSDGGRSTGWQSVDGGYYLGESGGVVRRDRFATEVVSFEPGPCSGFGQDQLPEIALGPPEGAGGDQGSTDVVSLGVGGRITIAFGDNAIIDGPGDDLVVFENAFYVAGSSSAIFMDPAIVSVSEDGVHFRAFPCADAAPYLGCAGTMPVWSSSTSGLSPFDPAKGGGNAYDLSVLGVRLARFVRIEDRGVRGCADSTNAGFDLDAVAILNAAQP